MLKKQKEMMLTFITNSSLLKICFGYSTTLWFSSIITPQNSEIGGFIESLINALPSKWAGYLGVIYGIAIVAKKISEVWKSHHLDRYEVKTAKEFFEQKEIETDSKRKKLDDL